VTPTSTSEQREMRVSKEAPPKGLVDQYAELGELRQRRHARDVVQHPDQVLEPGGDGAQTSPIMAAMAEQYSKFDAAAIPVAPNQLDERLQLAQDIRSMAMALLRLTRE
jgi:hypothetical protein